MKRSKCGFIFLILIILAPQCRGEDPVNYMQISSSLGFQFWDINEETYNQSSPYGYNKKCFCTIWKCDQEIKIQGTDDPDQIFNLVLYDKDDNELTRVEFTEVASGVYQLAFTPSLLSSPLCNISTYFVIEHTPQSEEDWTPQVAAEANQWSSVTFGSGFFVAVSSTGTNRVMKSLDGESWNAYAAAAAVPWTAVTFGNNIFIAVSGFGDVMTSADGENWDLQSSSSAEEWKAVAFGNGLFVAVGNVSVTGDVMVSADDGLSWTTYSAFAGGWTGIAFGAGLFVAVGVDNAVMTSPDGENWTLRTGTTTTLLDVAYNGSYFVAVGVNGVMRSVDGITWEACTEASNDDWDGVVSSGGSMWVAVAGFSDPGASMVSFDNGLTWQSKATPADNTWTSVTFGDNKFVAVASDIDSGERVMTLEFVAGVQENQTDCIEFTSSVAKLAGTVLVHYSNARDYDGLIYAGLSPVPEFYLRIKGRFVDTRKIEENESIPLTNNTVKKLSSSIESQRLLEVDYAPDWLHDKLQNVLAHIRILEVDGITVTKKEPYDRKPKPFPNKKYTQCKGQVWLTTGYITNVL